MVLVRDHGWNLKANFLSLSRPLCGANPSPGEPIPVRPPTPLPIADGPPASDEVAEACKELCLKQAAEATGVHTKDLRRWLQWHKCHDNGNEECDPGRDLLNGRATQTAHLVIIGHHSKVGQWCKGDWNP